MSIRQAIANLLKGPAMKTSAKGIALIKTFEGCAKRQKDGTYIAYPDPATGGAPWTIGWGATGREIGPGVVWTQAQCDARLVLDLRRFEKAVSDLTKGHATQNQFDALVSFAYNCGPDSLRTSTLLRKHMEGDYAGAALQFARWSRAAGRVLPGLTRRRMAETALYRGEA